MNPIPAPVPLWLTFPFGLLLLLIATMPLTRPTIKAWWDKYYPAVSLGLAALVAFYYTFQMSGGVQTLGHTAGEYLSFICLIGALYVVAGGIHMNVKGEATPLENIVFLIVGAFVANLIGTTGASMVLIRPWVRMNKVRVSAYHVVFFIFIVSNVGGALTPIGDPPLFLGYLEGVPFFWLVQHVLPQWLLTLGAILGSFYFYDVRSFKHMPRKIQLDIQQHPETWRFEGTINVIFLLVIIGAVFLPDVFFIREIAVLATAVASYFLTPSEVHLKNQFGFGPIKEVALLFIGIFATMMPVLQYLELHGTQFGFIHPLQYYFGSGTLSSVLDNAPTYVNFLQLAKSTASAAAPGLYAVAGTDPIASTQVLLADKPFFVVAVSLGSVFFGAMTYIGNGPNFMVKSIAHDAGVRCPTFFGYIFKFSLPVLLPILAIVGWIFLHR